MTTSRAVLRATRAFGSPRIASRSFSVASRMMAEGDTGAPRSGGAASSDAFTKRESASEEMFIRDQERQKLASLRAKIGEHKKHLEELEKHVDDLSKEQGGEQN
ncbi:putative ATPase inhibitor mitochondrial precursor [Viridothelium virens]|uniref:ATPase inhibitor, mitochondrial n=1 Tax=Viridothelium virens TaxID=1048519 RepID=A0A6A6H4X2_VIRVR|nr:putative ATPase inhibitor mitochondrial precursor [Viridothelium virens]